MVTKQEAIMQAIAEAAVEAVKTAVQAMVVSVGSSTSRSRNGPTDMEPKPGEPMVKQTKFDWEAIHKYPELKNFRLRIKYHA